MPSIYSYSKISTFKQCKLKYKFKYIDKIIPEIGKTIEAHLGGAVHSALEWLYIEVLQNRMPSIEELIVKFSEKWKEEFSEDIVIVKPVRTFQDYFDKGVKILLNYYLFHKPFNDNTLELEKKIVIELSEDKRYIMQGYIDRISFNLKTNEYEIHDYKTSESLPSKEKIANDRQLAIYSIWIKKIFGKDKKVKLVWHYLNFNKMIISEITDDYLEKIKEETMKLIDAIESEKEFPLNKSSLCDWCEYKPTCPAWKNTEKKYSFEKQSSLDRFN